MSPGGSNTSHHRQAVMIQVLRQAFDVALLPSTVSTSSLRTPFYVNQITMTSKSVVGWNSKIQLNFSPSKLWNWRRREPAVREMQKKSLLVFLKPTNPENQSGRHRQDWDKYCEFKLFGIRHFQVSEYYSGVLLDLAAVPLSLYSKYFSQNRDV